MDLDCFSKDNFDAVQWVNHYVEHNGTGVYINMTVTMLVSKLQLYVEQINGTLERSSNQLMNIISQVINNAKALDLEILLLTRKMHQLQNEIYCVQRDTKTYMVNLERMEGISYMLRKAKYGIQESDGWGRLIAELDELLECNDIHGAKQKYVELKKSISAQIGLPGQAERDLQLEYSANRIEAMASSEIVKYFQLEDTEKCLEYVYVFQTISRISQLEHCYRTLNKNVLLNGWMQTVKTEDTCDILSNYYDILLNFVHNQQKWCRKVQISTVEPFKAVIETLTELQCSREDFVMGGIKKTSEKMELLIKISFLDAQFASSLKNICEELYIADEYIEGLMSAVFEYFEVFIKIYLELEAARCNAIIKNLEYTDTAEKVRYMDIINTKTTNWIEDSIQRCRIITKNRSILDLVHIFDSFFVSCIEEYKKILERLFPKTLKPTEWSSIRILVNLLQCLGDMLCIVRDSERKIYTSASTLHSKTTFNLLQNRWDDNGKSDNHLSEEMLNESNELFPKQYDQLRKLGNEAHDIILTLLMFPIEKQFGEMNFTEEKEIGSIRLPDYSFAPHEYITQIGQYLLTLPQHLEPLLLRPSNSLKLMMEFCEHKYSYEKPCSDILLSFILEKTSMIYQIKIDEIFTLSDSDAKQLAVDIEYFGNVLEEMNLQLSVNLHHTITLLRAPLEQYNAASSGCNAKLVTTIRQKRNIISC